MRRYSEGQRPEASTPDLIYDYKIYIINIYIYKQDK